MQTLLFLISVMHPNIVPLSSFVIAISRYVKIFIIFIVKHYCNMIFLLNLNQHKIMMNVVLFAISKGKNEYE